MGEQLTTIPQTIIRQYASWVQNQTPNFAWGECPVRSGVFKKVDVECPYPPDKPPDCGNCDHNRNSFITATRYIEELLEKNNYRRRVVFPRIPKGDNVIIFDVYRDDFHGRVILQQGNGSGVWAIQFISNEKPQDAKHADNILTDDTLSERLTQQGQRSHKGIHPLFRKRT